PSTAAGKAAAAVVAVMAAEPEPKVDPAPRKEAAAQDAPPARAVDTGADRRTTQPAIEPAPEPDPSTDAPVVEGEATSPGKVGADAAVLAVLAATPNSPVKPVTSVGKASDKSATTAPTEPSTPTEKAPSGNRPEPPITAKAETQLQPSGQRIGGTAQSLVKPDKNNLENRIRSFLQNYCNTYAAKNLDAFTNLFIPDARENGTPFIRLLPKYKRNFEFIETIEYRIELQQFSYDENMGIVSVDGDFFLKWLPPDKKWRENAGKISMSLQEKGPSFLVRQLDYQGGNAKKK
ncbi:MAG: hypothetical protein KFF68_17700, partial [Desulfosarcina sp.]|nr:hypothetical protein [Desulfosarcina sp.]